MTRNAVGVIGLVLGDWCRVSFAEVQESCSPHLPRPLPGKESFALNLTRH